MHITGLQTAHTVLKTPTCFGAEVPSSGTLKYKVVQAPIHRSGKYNLTYYDFGLELVTLMMNIMSITLQFYTYHFTYVIILIFLNTSILDIALPRSTLVLHVLLCILDSYVWLLGAETFRSFSNLCTVCNPIVSICWWM